MHMRSFRNWSYYWSKKNPHFAVSRWRRRMTTLFGQHGCSKNNVPILLLYWAKCLLQIKAGKIKPVLTTCQPGSQHTTSPFLSPNSLPCPPFLLYHILELFTTQAPQNWRLMRCAPPPLNKWVRCYIRSHGNAFHGLKMLPSVLRPRGGQRDRQHRTGWRKASVAGLRVTGSQISPLELARPQHEEMRNMPAGVTKCSKEVDTGKEKWDGAGREMPSASPVRENIYTTRLRHDNTFNVSDKTTGLRSGCLPHDGFLRKRFLYSKFVFPY